jgi:hypothetical protein
VKLLTTATVSHARTEAVVKMVEMDLSVLVPQDGWDQLVKTLTIATVSHARMVVFVTMEMMDLSVHVLLDGWVPLVKLQIIASASHARTVAHVQMVMMAFHVNVHPSGLETIAKNKQDQIVQPNSTLAMENLDLATSTSLTISLHSLFSAMNGAPNVLRCHAPLELSGVTHFAVAS